MKSIWGRYQGRDWEWLDEEDEDNDTEALLGSYTLAFGAGWEFEIREEEGEDAQ